MWTEWSDYGDCSVTCGPGNKSRHRTCTPGIHGVFFETNQTVCTEGDKEYIYQECEESSCPESKSY